MGKKILKIILWIFIGIFGLLLLVSMAVYIPPVQNFIKNKAASIVSSSTGMQLSIERFRLRFPLNVEIDRTILITPQGDTLLQAGKVTADVALWPLLSGRVQAREIGLTDASVHYADTLSAMTLRAVLGEFTLHTASMGLSDSDIRISGAELRRGDVGLWMGESHKPDTINVDTVPALWKIRLDRLDIEQLAFRMHTTPHVTELTVDLPSARIDNVDFDLGAQDVSAGLIRLSQGQYAYLTDPATVVPAPVVLQSDAVKASPMAWNIRLDRLELEDNGLRYGVLDGEPVSGFDPNHIELSGVNIRIDEIDYRETSMGASIRQLTARERSGLEITEANGDFSMDSARILLRNFNLKTPNSSLSADAEVAAGLLQQDPAAPLSALLKADLNPVDLYYFTTPDASLRRTLAGQTLRVDGDFAGTLSQLHINTLTANMPGHIDFRADGEVINVLDTDNLGGNIRMNGTFANLDFIRPMLPDSMRNRIGFPDRMTLGGTLAIAGGTYAPDIRLTADSGLLALKGRVNLRRESYDADVTVTDFPLGTFLPKDTLGLLTLNLTAKGQGFDPRREGAAADVDFALGRFDFKQYTYHDITLQAALADHLVNGHIDSDNPAIQLHFDLNGELRPEKYAAQVTGRIDTVDLRRAGLMAGAFNVSLLLDAKVEAYPDTTYRADVTIDSLRWRHGYHTDRIDKTTVVASADRRQVVAAVRSGDLTLDFNAPVALDSLISGFSSAAARISEQLEARSLDMENIQQALPSFALQASARQQNILHALLSESGMDFRSVDVQVSTLDDRPLRGTVVVNRLNTGSLTLDTLNVGVMRRDNQLAFFARLANRPGNVEEMALIALAGNIGENRATARFFQRNRSDSVGFRFGLEAELQDSAVRVQLTPANPVFGYIPWTANPDNYLVYHFDNRLEANLRLEGDGGAKHVYITSAPLPTIPIGAIKLDMKGIDIGETLRLLPSPPAVDGILNTDIGFGLNGGEMAAVGTLGIDSLVYDQRRVGNIGLDVDFQSDSLNRYVVKAGMTANGQSVLQADGTYLAGDGGLAVRATVSSLPLTLANAFLPEETAQLDGALNGWFAISGSTGNPVVNGELTFAEGKFTMPMIGTAFGLSARPLKFNNSTLDFNRFSLTSPNNQNLVIDGTVNFSDFSRLTTDLSLRAREFDVISSTRSGGSQIYGKAPVDITLTAKGVVNALTVRGDIALKRGTDVTYTLREGPLEVEDVKQDIVTFVDFNDPATFLPADSTSNLQVFGIDLLVNIDIEENVEVTVNISEDGNNRAEVAGYGNLTYTMNTQGDSRFMGRFDIASGRILYNPPVISQKDFAINQDSYVEWTGELLNPTFDITAVETVNTTVKSQGNVDRTVAFNVMILVRNTLEDLDLVFDLAAPNDTQISNELGIMTQEQRSTQAMALLAYNTYTGLDGSSATAISNDPLNSFISKELNQWARNNLQGVDLSLGLNTVDDGTGNTHTDYSYQVSKSFLDDRVKVSVGGSVDPTASGNENLKNNFVQDVSIEYRLTKRDNMFLKAYRYNTQESMLEGEITETGVGFLLRKRMNKLGDLFKLAPKEERRQRREIRREFRRDRRQAEDEQADPASEQNQETPEERTEGQPPV